jgi:L-2-hydroxyglutarate oxidase
LCREGTEAVKRFCSELGVPFKTPGKLVVATNAVELNRMAALAENGAANGIALEVIDAAELERREPGVTGLGAIAVAQTGIVDYQAISAAMVQQLRELGCDIAFSVAVERISESANDVVIASRTARWTTRKLFVCAGLQADRLARLAGIDCQHRIIPFRGEYYALRPELSGLVSHMIYPVPDPDLPFLGIHLTPMMDGRLTVGPNAVLGMAREGYQKWSISPRDVLDYLSFPGFWKTISANLTSGLDELGNSLFASRYLEQCRKYWPSLELADLLPYRAGIRAQAVARDGTLVHDFLFARTARMVHVLNAPSPAATSAIPIARMIVSGAN